jgi:hypothetical protein
MPEGGETMSEDVREQNASPPDGAVRTVLCVYCRQPIASDAFAYWSTAQRLLSAVCPGCARRVTLPAATWRRLSIPFEVTVRGRS